mgnify:CR=1 FL=1
MHGKGWKFAIGVGTAFLLVSAPISRPLWPQFAGIVQSSRDVMAVWFAVAGCLAIGALAWRVSPAITWLVGAYTLSGLAYGFQGLSMMNLQALLWGTGLLALLTYVWPEHKGMILWALTVALAAHITIALSQYFVEDYGWPAPAGLVYRDPFFMTAKVVHEVEGLASHYSLLGGLLAVAMPLVYLRVGWIVWIVVPLVSLVTQHRATMMAAALSVFLMIPGRRKWHAGWIGLLLSGAVMYLRGAFSDFAGPSLTAWTSTRIDVWVIGFAKALQKPWLGWSPGAWYLWKPTFITPPAKTGLTFIQAHNEFLQLFFEVGIIGLLAVVIYVVHTGWRLRRARPWTLELRCAVASVAGLGFIAFVSFPFRIAVTAVGGIITLAALHGELLEIEDKRKAADRIAQSAKSVAMEGKPNESARVHVPRRKRGRLAAAGDPGAGNGGVSAVAGDRDAVGTGSGAERTEHGA